MIREIEVKNNADFVKFIDKPLVADDVQAYQIVFQTGQDVTGCTPTITVTRADGVKIIGDGTADGTTATYMLSNNMYAVPGELIARLTVTSPTGSILTDCELHFYVVPGNGTPDISGDDRVPVLNQLIIDATNAANYANTQGDYAKEQGEYAASMITDDGGFAAGEDAHATTGAGVGNSSNATTGGSVGSFCNTDTGGAVGDTCYSNEGGFAGGNGAMASNGGVAAGFSAETDNGGLAGGAHAKAGAGFAGGQGAVTGDGVAAGYNAKTENAQGIGINAIQLGEGTNTTPLTFKVYGYQLLDATGQIPAERLANTLGDIETVLDDLIGGDSE